MLDTDKLIGNLGCFKNYFICGALPKVSFLTFPTSAPQGDMCTDNLGGNLGYLQDNPKIKKATAFTKVAYEVICSRIRQQFTSESTNK